MLKKAALWCALVCALFSASQAQNCVTVAYYTGYNPTFYAGFPLTGGGNTFTKVAYYINPAADGNVQSMRMMFYNNNLVPVVPHTGTFRVWAYSDNAGVPNAVEAGPLNVNAAPFAAVYGTWDSIDLTGLAYSFTANVPFHIVWEFIPSGTSKLDPLGVTGAGYALGNQMYNSTLAQWGWWFTGSGDLMEEVTICYVTTPPGDLQLGTAFVDMGRSEDGTNLSETFQAFNHGGMNTTVSAVSTTNPAVFSASVAGGLPQVLTPGDSLSFTVTFNSGAATIFRDTTHVDLAWTSNAQPTDHTYFAAIAGSSDCRLTNDWTGAPDELDWYVAASGDTSIYGGTWQLFSGGLNRNFPFAGHGYTAEGDTASSELYAFLDNANLDDIDWTFAHTQNYPADTQDHALLVYGVENDVLTFLYGFDVTSFQQQAPTWAHLTAALDSLPDSLACSFYYGGSYADSWFVDDVEFCRSCSVLEIGIAYQPGNLVALSWAPYPGETVQIWRSNDAYDFSGAVLVATEASETGGSLQSAAGNQGFYRAVRDCSPAVQIERAGLVRLDRHPDGVTTRRMSDLVPVTPSRERGRTLPLLQGDRQPSVTRHVR